MTGSSLTPSNVTNMTSRKLVAIPREENSLPEMLRRFAADIEVGNNVLLLGLVVTDKSGTTYVRRFDSDGKILATEI